MCQIVNLQSQRERESPSTCGRRKTNFKATLANATTRSADGRLGPDFSIILLDKRKLGRSKSKYSKRATFPFYESVTAQQIPTKYSLFWTKSPSILYLAFYRGDSSFPCRSSFKVD